ncbi:M48 family metalloprotease [Halopiger thermotolerans]
MSLRLRICGVLAALVAINALFVLVLLWAYGILLPGVVAGTVVFLQHGAVPLDFARLPVSWPTACALIGGFLLAQIYYGYRRVLSGTRAGDGDHEIARTVRRLAMTADVPEPNVRIVDDDAPSCYTVGRLTDATIVVTTGLVDRLDADELEAVLAHEIAHIANRDVTLMTITTLFVEIADRAYHWARLVRRAVTDPRSLSTEGRLAIQWFLPLAALTYVFVAPLLWLFPTVADWATRTLSHAREFAADDAAARITGKPLALATALVTLAEATETPTTDLRTAKTRALCVVPTDLVTGREVGSVSTLEDDVGATATERERRETVAAWLDGATPTTATTASTGTGTHPPVEARLERLQMIAVDQELEGSV